MKLSTMRILINYLSVNKYCSAEALNPNNVLKTTGEAKLAGSSSGSSRSSMWQQETAAMGAVVEAAKTAAVAEKATAAAAAAAVW